MRAATLCTLNVSRATRAAMMLELSPLLTAAKASARSMPAWVRTALSKPTPVTRSPLNAEPSLRNASGSRSMTETVLSRSSRMWASVDPTRPQPMITMCMTVPPRQAGPPIQGCLAKGMPSRGILPRLGWRIPVPFPGRVREAADTGHANTLASTNMPGEVGRRSLPGRIRGHLAASMMDYRAGQVIEVTTRDVAHGGWCVAQPEDGLVVFLGHALPGETVLARLTEVTSRLARADP